jgi:hypothetical protein
MVQTIIIPFARNKLVRQTCRRSSESTARRVRTWRTSSHQGRHRSASRSLHTKYNMFRFVCCSLEPVAPRERSTTVARRVARESSETFKHRPWKIRKAEARQKTRSACPVLPSSCPEFVKNILMNGSVGLDDDGPTTDSARNRNIVAVLGYPAELGRVQETELDGLRLGRLVTRMTRTTGECATCISMLSSIRRG